MDSLTNNIMTNQSDMQGWEFRQVSVTRVPGYGFGIAVSGGRDNPHFSSGDPSIAVSDVLTQGPAERLLQVNDRILSVNGISLQNVDYATAVQVLRDSGDTVVLSIKRRVASQSNHQHSHSLSASYSLPPSQNNKVTLTKNSKKEDFGIILGCKLFVKEISSKARDQLALTNQHLAEGDFISKINNTSCNDMMSLKEAKKIIDGCKDKLNLVIARDGLSGSVLHQTQSSISTTGAVNNYYNKGDDLFVPNQSYSNQNLYVQPPTRHPQHQHTASYNEDMSEDKSNLVPRGGRLRGPLNDSNLSRELEAVVSNRQLSREPPRPPPPRPEDYYTTRRQLYEEDPLLGKTKQQNPDARFIAFQKEGSVGIRLTGGNHSGIFVTAVQPGSPASLQGLQPGDKILKVNDMDMTGVTREEAVLFLLSLQDRIELIVQYCKDEYDAVVASQKGDSFYIKTHFHYESPVKGEMTFRSGDIFHVIDTLYNGVVGCWQVYRIGRTNQEVQKGIIPNKARAEELATAQFNATKKEMSANESRGSFFRRRRSSNRRSKSLGKEHWDDILFSDSVSKFPAYERVILRHPGFMRPVILFGPIADIAREKLLKDFPDKFISPQLENGLDENKSTKSSHIIRLSAIRDVISTGKHALLDITPNAVERLNYAQLYPIVVFFKTESKIVIKQLRQGLPKSAHKSSKKLLEQCSRLDKVWGHVFGGTITLSEPSEYWYRKLREIIDRQQANALWMSETKPEESLSDDFLFPMSSLRLSYASSPESDLEHSPGPPGASAVGVSGSGTLTAISTSPSGRLTKASSDPSINHPTVNSPPSDHDVPPPYQATYDSKYGFGATNRNDLDAKNMNSLEKSLPLNDNNQSDTLSSPNEANYKSSSGVNNMLGMNGNGSGMGHGNGIYGQAPINNMSGDISHHERQKSSIHGTGSGSSYMSPKSSFGRLQTADGSPSRSPRINEGTYGPMAPDLPPRIDRAVKPSSLLSKSSSGSTGRSAHERLFGTKPPGQDGHEQNNNPENNYKTNSLENSKLSSYDSVSSYDSYHHQSPHKHPNIRLGPNAHDDLKSSVPEIKHEKTLSSSNGGHRYSSGGHRDNQSPRTSYESDHKLRSPDGRQHTDMYRYNKSPAKQTPNRIHYETKTDYGKYRKSQYDINHSNSPENGGSQGGILTTVSSMQHFTNGMGNDGMMPPPHPMTNGNGHNTNSYKPIPPPKPKNYKPPFKNNGSTNNYVDDGQMNMSPPIYQHGKSNSHPAPMVDQRPPNYYYNIPPSASTWHGGGNGVDGNGGTHFAQSMIGGGGGVPPYEHRHAGDGMHYSQDYHRTDHNRFHSGELNEQQRTNIVDLQGSREQRGSAFELYRKPMHHNLSSMTIEESLHVTTNISSSLITNNMTNTSQNSPCNGPYSYHNHDADNRNDNDDNVEDNDNNITDPRHSNDDDVSEVLPEESNLAISEMPHTSSASSTPHHHNELNDNTGVENDVNVTSAVVDHKGGRLENTYWGVSLDIPEGAIPDGMQQHIYFVITDPRSCDNAPPLDFENGETLLSPLVMCGPQGLEFQKSVVLNIPHYAHTLPSLAISLKATDSERNLQTDWDNILLPSNHTANCVAVKVDHF